MWGAWSNHGARLSVLRLCGQEGLIVADFRPPFTLESAIAKVRAAEDAWNTREPQRVALAYSVDTEVPLACSWSRPADDPGIPDVR